MSAQATFDLPDFFMDFFIPPESILPADQFSPEFVSLTQLLENENHHQETELPFLQTPSCRTGTVEAAALKMQDKGEENTNRPRLRNRAIRPAPQGSSETSIDARSNPAPPFLLSYPSIPSSSSSSFSNSTAAANYNSESRFDNDSLSPYSDPSSNKVASSPRRRNRDTDKRAKHLERNRVAASKSRRKKKRETNQLQNQFQEVSRRKSRLEIEVKDLNSQLLFLKDQILMHSRCNDEAIHTYLGHIVKQTARHDFSHALTSEADDEDDHQYMMSLLSMSPP
ncbi:hypothetical protein ASPCAL10864 [Aspergillus calidoustus]|uniref:BZIP domain-containing protein n=1 Tax=Aspergillus calidoustus TaxID=454130 RepID=A0A0U5G9U7_ASPCI|nr:hypothetical protein ASPCAL10864 [Aspergillus calidoustus]